MANTFKNYASANVGTSPVSVLTATTSTTVIGYTCANTTNAGVQVSIQVTLGGTDYYLVKNAVVPVGGALIPVGGDQKLVLETNDVIKVTSSVDNSVDVIISVLEIS